MRVFMLGIVAALGLALTASPSVNAQYIQTYSTVGPVYYSSGYYTPMYYSYYPSYGYSSYYYPTYYNGWNSSYYYSGYPYYGGYYTGWYPGSIALGTFAPRVDRIIRRWR